MNVGCIPSKALLHSAQMYYDATEGHFASNGINVKAELDLSKMMAHKDKSVKGLTGGIQMLFKKNKVQSVFGHGKLTGPNSVQVIGEDGEVVADIEAKNIIIATGSEPSSLPGVDVEVDEKLICTSDGAIALPKVPENMIVIGGGIIGLELGSVWSKLGANVEVVEFMDRIMPFADREVSKTFTRIMKKQGLKLTLGTKVTDVQVEGDTATVTYERMKNGKVSTKKVDSVLVAVGRKPYTDNLGLEALGIETDRFGRIPVDHKTLKTSVPSIYGIGDVIDGPMLAHKAEEDGIYVAECIAGQPSHLNWANVPSVMYTYPEVAWVGKSEEELKEDGVAYGNGSFPFMANSRARALGITDGFVKVLTDKGTGKILGAHIIAPGAGEMILPLTMALEYGGAAEDVARTCTAHPTFSEAIKEACMAAYDKPIHF